MKNKKGFKHYLQYYLIVVAVYVIYISILAIRNKGYDVIQVLGVLYIPFVFIFFVYLFDRLFDPIFRRFSTKEKEKEKKSFHSFIKVIDDGIRERYDFTLEDFRRLRENDRFQKACLQAYRIAQEGETKELNLILLEKKFKKDTREYNATMVVIDEVKKKMAN